MKLALISMRLVFATLLLLSQSAAIAQEVPVIKPMAEMRVTELPAGPLFWRLENYPTLTQAQAAAGPLGLVAQAEDRVWLFTLGARGGISAGGTKVAEIGPIPKVVATQYLLRIQEAIVSPGGGSAVHAHPGSESFYVVAGERSTRTPRWGVESQRRRRRAGSERGYATASLEQRLNRHARACDVCA